MAEARLVFRKPLEKKIGTIVISAFSTETHDRNSQITDYPVEEGADISDHVINFPETLSISGIIEPEGDGSNVLEVFRDLNNIRDNKESVSVITGLKVYSDMIIESLSFPRSAGNGASLSFTAAFKKISVVSSQAVAIPNSILSEEDGNTNKQSQGEQDIGKTTSGQTQSGEGPDGEGLGFLDEIDRQIDNIFSVADKQR